MRFFQPEAFALEHRNPAPNVWLVECFDDAWNTTVIPVPDDWAYPLPENAVQMGHRPLSAAGASATLNVILGLWTLEDAANAVKVHPDDLVAEAQTWAEFVSE